MRKLSKIQAAMLRQGSTAAELVEHFSAPESPVTWDSVLAICEQYGVTWSDFEEGRSEVLDLDRCMISMHKDSGIFSGSDGVVLIINQDLLELFKRHRFITH